MPRRQSPQQVTNLPFSQPEAAAVVVAEAAAVLAGMPRRQAQLQWASPGGATERLSDLEPPPPSPAVSAARPPLAAHAQLAGGASMLAFPPRRGGALSTSVVAPPLRAGASATAGVIPPHKAAAQVTGGVVIPFGAAPRIAGFRLPPRRAIPTATGRLPATRRTPAVSTGKRALGASTTLALRAAGATKRPARPPSVPGAAVAVPIGTHADKRGGQAAGSSSVSVVDVPCGGRNALARVPLVTPSSALAPGAGPPCSGAHRPSLSLPPVQSIKAAARLSLRALAFKVPQAAVALSLAGERSLTLAVAGASPKA